MECRCPDENCITCQPYKFQKKQRLHAIKNFKPVILFRLDRDNEDEYLTAKKYFDVYTHRSEIPKNSLVVARYSALPYYRELEQDLKNNGSVLINSYDQHQFVADIQNWCDLLEYQTPLTWMGAERVPYWEYGPFIVKGRTNSRKHNWNTKMYVPKREDLGEVIAELMGDPLIADQGICIRKYMPLETILEGINGLPITMEFRVFVCNGFMVDNGYYWSSHALDVKEKLGTIPDLNKINDQKAWNLIMSVANTIYKHPDGPLFYTIDIARRDDGNWMVVELNDGQMAGLSEVKPDNFYRLLKLALHKT